MEKIKELRNRSGAGMLDCQKALTEAGGDLEKAIEILRKKGIAKAAKRSERQAGEGLIKVAVNDSRTEGYLLELNSETDFVARNEKFQNLLDDIFTVLESRQPASSDELLTMELNGSRLEDQINSLSGVIGEKIVLGRIAVLKGATVAAYSHLGCRLGVLLALNQPGQSDLATDIAMHIAAANPRYLDSSEIPAEELEQERNIYREQLVKEGKAENIIDNILNGKMKKYYSEVCLLDQEYIKDDKKTVRDVLAGVQVEKFFRFSL